jgi:hypothetical protein
LFKNGSIKPKTIFKKFVATKEKATVTLNREGQLNMMCRNVKFTFYDFNFDIPHNETIGSITLPSLLDLAAMKAYALGRRSKWKDYVDLYFILKNHYSINEVGSRASVLFDTMFNEKLFKGQLSYFTGISFEEQIEFIPGFEVSEDEVKTFLIEAALEEF